MTSTEDREKRQRRLRRNAAAKALKETQFQQKIVKVKNFKTNTKLNIRSIEDYLDEQDN